MHLFAHFVGCVYMLNDPYLLSLCVAPIELAHYVSLPGFFMILGKPRTPNK